MEIRNTVLMASFAVAFPAHLFADVLVSGSVYFDSAQTFEEVKRLAAQGDNTAIARLISDGHVSKPVTSETEVSVIAPGQRSDSPVEFRFKDKPATYWTVAKFVKMTSPSAAATDLGPGPATGPTPAQAAGPAPAAAAPTPATARSHPGRRGYHTTHRYWHLVDGHWRWSPVPLNPSDRPSERPPQ